MCLVIEHLCVLINIFILYFFVFNLFSAQMRSRRFNLRTYGKRIYINV